MRLRIARGFVGKRRRTLSGRGQKGFVLIELLVSIAIFGVISVGFLSALVAGYHGVIVAHDVTTAQSLTRTTLENVRSATYPLADYQTTTPKFDVVVNADYVDINYDVVTGPTDVQMITVTVRYHESGSTLLVTQNTKVKA
jgi:prepilin-type N-terminal cleavage/methylation domain-containing protein